jgi:hypothetical protein
LKFYLIFSSFLLIYFYIWFYFYSDGSDSQQCAHCYDWEKHTFYCFFKSHKLTFVLCFQAPPSLWDFFQLSSTCPFHLKIGTCSLNIIWTTILTFTPRGIHKILIIQGWIKNKLSRQAGKKKKQQLPTL